MRLKLVQQMIQEVVDGKDAKDLVNDITEENENEDEVIEEEPETPVERAKRFLDERNN
jgi:ketol-acid reductoisomerase